MKIAHDNYLVVAVFLILGLAVNSSIAHANSMYTWVGNSLILICCIVLLVQLPKKK
jgi:hypothetical protein